MRFQNVVCRSAIAFLAAATLLGAIVGPMSLTSANGGKPTPPPPPPPPVKYYVTWLDNLGRTDTFVFDMNNSGRIVGRVQNNNSSGIAVSQTAFVYAGAASGAVIDLDLHVVDIIGEIRGDWTLTCAYGINEADQIVGVAESVTGETRGFVTDNLWTQCLLLPPSLIAGGQKAKKINLLGEVVAEEGNGSVVLYRWDTQTNDYALVSRWFPTTVSGPSGLVLAFNDNGQILVNGARYTPGLGWQDFTATDGVVFSLGMNQAGAFVGARDVGRKRYSYRYSNGAMQDITTGRGAYDINADGDVCVSPSSRGYVYTDRNGLLALDNLVIGSAADVTAWKNASLTLTEAMNDDIGTTGFGAISGRGVFNSKTGSTTKAFLLFPTTP